MIIYINYCLKSRYTRSVNVVVIIQLANALGLFFSLSVSLRFHTLLGLL